MADKYSILIVDDEKIQRESLAGFLNKQGYQTYTAASVPEALNLVRQQVIEIVFSDYKMGEHNGYELLLEVKKINPEISFILMTAFGTIQDAVAAMKAGAYDYLTKPVDLDEVELLVNRALEWRHLERENRELRERLRDKHKLGNILTSSSRMVETLSLAARAASSKTAVLIQGESGTGKELIARAIHQASPRADKPLVTINCAAIAENLLESELFGHEKGAFTGAVQQKSGLVEEADGGTLFLDEIGDVPLPMQVKLLRFLQFGEFQRVGDNQVRRVDVRLISATNRDLQQLISENKFREDFYYRLNVINIQVPPLRQRREDISLLTDYFIKKYATQNNKPVSRLTNEALDILIKYDFPGNVRELENIIERAVVLARDERITRFDLPITLNTVNGATGSPAPADYYQGDFHEKVQAFETDMLLRALKENNNNQSRAAESLGLSERNLRYKLQKYKLK